MIAVCLRQVDGYARRLKNYSIWSGTVAKKGENFLSIFKSEELKDMRDALEHAADYVAGHGDKPQPICLFPAKSAAKCRNRTTTAINSR